ncbi:MAG: PHP domain-containing protein [bacterium]
MPRIRVLSSLAAIFSIPATLFAIDPPDTGVKRTSLERFQVEHLKKTDDDARAIRAGRQPRPLPSGWLDVRSIFHAHAEDSEHTGGTRPEMIAEAKKAGVKALFLSDHFRPPRDFFTPERRGMVDGILLVPGSEWAGFLIHPTRSVIDHMKSPAADMLKAVRADGGFAYLSHVEERPDHAMDQLDGLEIYNRHYDAKVDSKGLLQLMLAMTSRKTISEFQQKIDQFPDPTFAFQVEYPRVYLEKWDSELQKKPLTGVAANDCHHNMVLIVKKADENSVLVGTNVDKDSQMRKIPAGLAPGIKELIDGKKTGDIVARIDLDPYHRSFANSSTHIFAKEISEQALRESLSQGRAYVSHDWVCDPAGFWVDILSEKGQPVGTIGDKISTKSQNGLQMKVALPVPGWVRLVRDGKVENELKNSAEMVFSLTKPGVYRLEVFQILDGEARGWIYANPVYITE